MSTSHFSSSNDYHWIVFLFVLTLQYNTIQTNPYFCAFSLCFFSISCVGIVAYYFFFLVSFFLSFCYVAFATHNADHWVNVNDDYGNRVTRWRIEWVISKWRNYTHTQTPTIVDAFPGWTISTFKWMSTDLRSDIQNILYINGWPNGYHHDLMSLHIVLVDSQILHKY